MKRRNLLILSMGILFSLSPVVMAQTAPTEPTPDKLVVVWTSGLLCGGKSSIDVHTRCQNGRLV